MRGLTEAPVVFCASVSQNEDSAKFVKLLIDRLSFRTPPERIVLEDLGPDDKRLMIARMLPGEVEPDMLEMLAAAWAGIPGLIVEGLEHLILTEGIRIQDDLCVLDAAAVERAVPDRLGDMAIRMLDTVDADTKLVLQLMAIAAGEVSLATLSGASGIELPVLRGMVTRDALRGAIATRTVGAGELCRFEHLAIGDKIAASLPPEEKKPLHDSLADAMLATADGEATSEAIAIVRHYLRGAKPSSGIGLMLEWAARPGAERHARQWRGLLQEALPCASDSEAMRLLEKVGDLCLSSGEFREAERLFERALKLASGAAGKDLRLMRKYAQACVAIGHHDAAREWAEKVLEVCRETDGLETREAAEAQLVLAKAVSRMGRLDDGLHHAQEAEGIGAILGDKTLQALALEREGAILIDKGRSREASGKLVRALMLFRSSADHAGVARTLQKLARVARLQQRWGLAKSFIQRALPPLWREGHVEDAGRALYSLGAIHQRLCQWDAACERYEDAVSIYERLSYSRGCAALLANLAQVNTYRGYLDTALRQCEAAVAAVPEEPDLKSQVLLRKASTFYFVGDLPAARQAALAALEVARNCESTGPSEFAHRLSGEIALLSGQHVLAEDHLNQALELARAGALADRETVCLARLAEVALAKGEQHAAILLGRDAVRKSESVDLDAIIAIIYSVHGRVALARGNLEEARSYLLRADGLLKRAPSCGNLMGTCLNLGRIYLALGQCHFAQYYLRNCLDIVEQVAGRFESAEMRRIFLADPRRQKVFQAIQALKKRAFGE